MPPPLASIVVPVWNRTGTLERALHSALRQTEPDLEVIVVDNGSDEPAAVAEIVDALNDHRVRLLRLPRNLGPSGGRNRGAEAAHGRLIGFLDSDDELEPTWLAQMSEPFGDDRCGVVTSGYQRVAADGSSGPAVVPAVLGPAHHNVKARFDGAPSFLLSRRLFADLGGYDERLWLGENTEIGLRIVDEVVRRGWTCVPVLEPLLRWHEGIPGRYNAQLRLDSAEIVLRSHAGLLASDEVMWRSYEGIAGVNAARLRDVRRARAHFGALYRRDRNLKNAARLAAASNPLTIRLAWSRSASSDPTRRKVRAILHQLAARRRGWFYVVQRGARSRWADVLGRWRARASSTRVIARASLGRHLVSDTEVGRECAVELAPLRQHPVLDGRPAWASTSRSPARHVLLLRDACILGGDGWIGVDGGVVEELGNAFDLPAWRRERALAALRSGERLGGRSASAAQRGFSNYFHWTLQGLPRLIEMIESVGGVGAVDRVVIPRAAPTFVTEALDRLGFDGEKVHVMDPATRVECEELVCATFVPEHLVLPEAYVAAVRGLYADALRDGDEILYVTRRDVHRRHLLNEAEVAAAVEAQGGRVVTPDGLTVAEQATLFSGARLVVALHGASLANTVFMPPAAAVLELIPANMPAAMFGLLNRSRGLAYDVVVGRERVAPRPLRVRLSDADVVVDVDDLVQRMCALLTITARAR